MPVAWLIWMSLQMSLLLMSTSGYSRHYVATGAGRLHYFEAQGSGSLPPVVLLHGIGSQASDLYLISEGLRPYVRKVIAVDLPGHGFSEVPVEKLSLAKVEASINQGLDRILAHEEPAILFGNSLGGWQALRYALHRPQELASLVAVSPAGARLKSAEHERLKQIFAHDSIEHPETLIPLLFNQTPPMPEMVASFLQARFSSPGVQALLAGFSAKNYLDPQRLRKLKLPILLIWGHQDRIFPEELAFFKHNLPPQTRFLEPEQFTHSPYIEAGMDQQLVQMMVGWEEKAANLAQGHDPEAAGGTLPAVEKAASKKTSAMADPPARE